MARNFIPLLLLLCLPPASAQEGPDYPCANCGERQRRVLPETGAWFNPEQSGTGLNLEVQNGVVVGYHYGYDAAGAPRWTMFTGTLTASADPLVQWQLEAALLHFEGGACIDCPYRPPSEPTEGETIRIRFLQRNHARVEIADNPAQFFVPITFGSPAHRRLPHLTDFSFPGYGDYFYVYFRPGENYDEPFYWHTDIYLIRESERVRSGQRTGHLRYPVQVADPSWDIPTPDIYCGPGEEAGIAACHWDVQRSYTIPVANMNERGFFGEAEDGSTVRAVRLFYD